MFETDVGRKDDICTRMFYIPWKCGEQETWLNFFLDILVLKMSLEHKNVLRFSMDSNTYPKKDADTDWDSILLYMEPTPWTKIITKSPT